MKTRKIITSLVAFFAFATAFAQNLPSYVPADGLVGYWGFDGNANDESGNGNNGTVNGAILTTDRFGNTDSAYSFDGVDDNINFHGINVNVNDNAINTVSFWMKWNGTNTVIPFCWISNYTLFFFENRVGINTYEANTIGISSNSFINQWKFVVIQFYNGVPSPNNSKLWVDGIIQTIDGDASRFTKATSDFIVGSGCVDGYFFSDKLDDIAMYNRALSQAEITQLYTGNWSPVATAQNFCGAARVANLKAVGTDLKWYDSETATTPLALTAKLMTQTYYVSQTIAGTESPRTAVAVTASPATSAIVVKNVVPLPYVTLGAQTWQTKNLDVATYSDGTPIPQVTDPEKWANLTTGAWCYYDNDLANGAVYGKLYNWYAVAGIWNYASKTDLTLRKKLAPKGYHVPTDDEWNTVNFMISPSEFAGLPGGCRNGNGYATFYPIYYFGFWSSSSSYGNSNAFFRSLGSNFGNANSFSYNKTYGFSVRCLRD